MATNHKLARFQTWHLTDVTRRGQSRTYHEFLRIPSMNAGLYVLAAGATDPQQPHAEDELYYVLRGRARFEADGQTTDVIPGALLFVARHVPHRFLDITEQLEVLVFFSSAK